MQREAGHNLEALQVSWTLALPAHQSGSFDTERQKMVEPVLNASLMKIFLGDVQHCCWRLQAQLAD